jgi:hypothetical protein
MATAQEASIAGSQLEAALRAGVRQISRDQRITFVQYQRTVLPVDGYLFWVSTGLTFVSQGSLHVASEIRQNEDETIGYNRIFFTTNNQIQEFNSVAPNILWLASIPAIAPSAVSTSESLEAPPDQAPGISGLTPSPIIFAFSSRGSYYRKANLFHYFGVSVQPPLLTQIVQSLGDLPGQPIVGNSLPIWLSLDQFAPVYPSFIVPQDVEPPYIVAHIEPESTEPLQAFAAFDPTSLLLSTPKTGAVNTQPINTGAVGAAGIAPAGTDPSQLLSSSQLLSENVRLTLYGFTNQTAIQYLQYLVQASMNDLFGFMNMPAIRDQKRVQSEIQSIAMKKVIDLEVSYYQSTSHAIALRLILKASMSITISDPTDLTILTNDSGTIILTDDQGVPLTAA